MIEIDLTEYEITLAALVGVMRQSASVARGRRDQHGAEHLNGFAIHTGGALAEYAVARYLDRFWTGMRTFTDFNGAADVGDCVQVRYRFRADGDLLLRECDRDDAPFVLVTGDAPRLALHGWIVAHDGKRSEWRRAPTNGRPPLFFVPREALRPMGDLSVYLDMFASPRSLA